MRHRLPRRREVAVGVEQESKLDGLSTQSSTLDDPLELLDPLGEVDDPCPGGEGATLVAKPGRGDDTSREVGEEGAQVVRLLEGTGTDGDEGDEVRGDRREEVGRDGAFSRVEAEEGRLDAVEALLQDRGRLRRIWSVTRRG